MMMPNEKTPEFRRKSNCEEMETSEKRGKYVCFDRVANGD
jgi:hypothetical protein